MQVSHMISHMTVIPVVNVRTKLSVSYLNISLFVFLFSPIPLASLSLPPPLPSPFSSHLLPHTLSSSPTPAPPLPPTCLSPPPAEHSAPPSPVSCVPPAVATVPHPPPAPCSGGLHHQLNYCTTLQASSERNKTKEMRRDSDHNCTHGSLFRFSCCVCTIW